MLGVLSGCSTIPSFADDPIYHASQALLAYDLLCQTTQIRKVEGVTETNPLLSDNPSVGEAVAYWAASALIHHAIYTAIRSRSEGWATVWAAAYASYQARFVIRNERRNQLRCW